MGFFKIIISPNWLPSSKLIIILENREYMAMLKEKLAEIKGVYGSLRSALLSG